MSIKAILFDKIAFLIVANFKLLRIWKVKFVKQCCAQITVTQFACNDIMVTRNREVK